MRRIGWLLLIATSAAFAATPIASSSTHWTWRSLHRPLHIPRIAPGAACPLSATHSVGLGSNGTFELPGPGPAYPMLLGGRPVDFFYPPLATQPDFYGTDWGGQKVLWAVTSAYHGPVLVRGRQLDGSNLVRFDSRRPLPAGELRILPGRGTHYRASFTRLRAAGCYAYQIDGTTFSRVIVFEARIVSPPG
jgi:hypothetical protein